MYALTLEAPSGIGSIGEMAGLELLGASEMEETIGGSMLMAGLGVAAGIGGALLIGVVVGASLYILLS